MQDRARKMNIEINKNGRITCVCYAGSTENSIEVLYQKLDNFFDYKYKDGEIVLEPIKNKDADFFKREYNEETDLYVEGAISEDIERLHNNLIDTLKAELLEDGFIYSDKVKTPHQQKCRDKDLSYLGNAIASMEDANIPTMKWYFNNGDMVELSLEEMKGLRANGAIFLSIVFGVEAQMKAEKPTKNITLEMFKDKVDTISQVKCWRD